MISQECRLVDTKSLAEIRGVRHDVVKVVRQGFAHENSEFQRSSLNKSLTPTHGAARRFPNVNDKEMKIYFLCKYKKVRKLMFR
jgi:hypothetical protein